MQDDIKKELNRIHSREDIIVRTIRKTISHIDSVRNENILLRQKIIEQQIKILELEKRLKNADY